MFYYEGSKEGKMLAELLQKSLIGNVDPQNHRVAKANSDYYILKNTSAPTVIVECGFLSNPEEESLLISAAYRKNWWKPCRRGSARIWWSINKSSVRGSERLAA